MTFVVFLFYNLIVLFELVQLALVEEFMIQVEHVTKSFDNHPVLKDFSCHIPDHSIYGLVGANGCGKSTLFRLMFDIYRPDDGVILVDGENIIDNSNKKREMVFIPDDFHFYGGYTLSDLFHFYASFYPTFDFAYAKELADLFHLDMKQKINTFSKGMKRQCSLISAFASKCKYLFFDETFDGIDPVIRKKMKQLLMKQITDFDATIVLTSHNLRELEDICDHLGLVYDGKLQLEANIDDLKETMFRVQISFAHDFDESLFQDLPISHFEKQGSVAHFVMHGDQAKLKKKLEKLNPILLDFLPVTLEEIFIYRMEEVHYEF